MNYYKKYLKYKNKYIKLKIIRGGAMQNSIPNTIPKTQSKFFMPLLTHAYYIVNDIPISSSITNEIEDITLSLNCFILFNITFILSIF